MYWENLTDLYLWDQSCFQELYHKSHARLKTKMTWSILLKMQGINFLLPKRNSCKKCWRLGNGEIFSRRIPIHNYTPNRLPFPLLVIMPNAGDIFLCTSEQTTKAFMPKACQDLSKYSWSFSFLFFSSESYDNYI